MSPGTGRPDYLTHWLALVSDEIHRSFERQLATEGVTGAQWRVLMTVYLRYARSVSDIARFLNTDVGSISRLVGRLEAKGLMGRSRDSASRRRKEVVLTPPGRELVPRLIELADHTEMYFFGSLTATERADLIQVLQRLLPEPERADTPAAIHESDRGERR